MNDIFYFSAPRVDIDDIASLARQLGWVHVHATPSGIDMRHDGERSRCSWLPFDLDSAEPAEAERLREEGITCAYCISHHPPHPALMQLLTELTRRYGGWVGNDSDDFLPRFDHADLAAFRYPPP